MNVFVFDIETVPDVVGARRLLELDALADEDVARAVMHKERMRSGSDFLRHHLHRVVAISVVLRSAKRFKVWSLGSESSDEAELIQRFYDGLARYTPTLVSWNGSGFDLPVLHYRSMLHRISAPRYWEVGDDEQGFRWNNYINRFHYRHTDLMDVLAGYQPRAAVKLDELAMLMGFPGKLGMDGSQVWEQFQLGHIGAIRDYCETDVLNTYLLYLRFELMRGRLDSHAYDEECDLVRESLAADGREHLSQFLGAWKS